MEFTSEDKILIDELLKRQAVDLFDLHRRYLLSPAQLSRSVRRLVRAGLIADTQDITGLSIRLADSGLRRMILLRRDILARNKDWKKVPKSMLTKHIGLDDPYVPNFRKLSRDMRSRQRQIRKELRGRSG
jgi:hypothetical protein